MRLFTSVLIAGVLAAVSPAHGELLYTITDLGTLGGDFSNARGMNDSGQVVGAAENPSGQDRAFLYDSGSMTDLGTLGGHRSEANGINDSGQVVGWAHNASDRFRAFLYESETMTDLGTLGGDRSEANGINDSGQVVGYAHNASDQSRAFLYDSGVMTDLGTFGGDYSRANGINDSGQVVGEATIPSGLPHAFLYHSGTMTDLNGLLPPDSGWEHLYDAWDINNNGQIVGYGWIDGQEHAFVMTPVPEPSTFALLGVFVLWLLVCALRTRGDRKVEY